MVEDRLWTHGLGRRTRLAWTATLTTRQGRTARGVRQEVGGRGLLRQPAGAESERGCSASWCGSRQGAGTRPGCTGSSSS